MPIDDEDKLVEAVEARLEETFADDDDIVDDIDDESGAEQTDEGEQAQAVKEEEGEPTPDDSPAAEPVKPADTTPAKENQEAVADNEEGGLSDALYRAAVHQGWTPDEIKTFYEGDPGKAVKTFQRIYESTNKLTAEFARLGKIKPELEQQQQAKPKSAAKAVSAEQLAALKEVYGDDDPLVKTVESLIEAIGSKPQEQVVQQQQPATEQVDQATQQMIMGFFADGGMKPYSEFYGVVKEGAALPEAQFKNRMAVLELADSILLGAERLGRKMNVPEALELAHLTISEPIREKAIRADIKSKMVKRSKSISLEPKGGQEAKNTGPVTQTELEAKVADKLNNIFNK